mmetsp:Transcript_2689/g.4487  ORF Transcript_2689/g.4487 Transcript_2689/m.4487 type:complete len:198 (+) Transcript_2689:181-774(+)
MDSFNVAPTAQLKALLHAAKYAHADVCGALLGKDSDEGKVEVTDAVPMFHSVVLAASVETGLALAEAYCSTSQTPEGTRVVGWYTGAARSNFEGTPNNATRIASRLSSKSGKPTILLQINTGSLAKPDRTGLEAFVSKDKGASWTRTNDAGVEDASVGKKFTELLREDAQVKLVDMDMWMDDSKLDWRNKDLCATTN